MSNEFSSSIPKEMQEKQCGEYLLVSKMGQLSSLASNTSLPPSLFLPPPPPQPDYSQLRSSINRFNSKICFVRLIFVKFTLNELVFRETNKRLCESNDDLRAALEVQKLSFLLFRCCCLFVFFVSFFSSFSPFIVSL